MQAFAAARIARAMRKRGTAASESPVTICGKLLGDAACKPPMQVQVQVQVRGRSDRVADVIAPALLNRCIHCPSRGRNQQAGCQYKQASCHGVSSEGCAVSHINTSEAAAWGLWVANPFVRRVAMQQNRAMRAQGRAAGAPAVSAPKMASLRHFTYTRLTRLSFLSTLAASYVPTSWRRQARHFQVGRQSCA